MNQGEKAMCMTAVIVMLIVLFCYSRKEGMVMKPGGTIRLGKGEVYVKFDTDASSTDASKPEPSSTEQAKSAAGGIVMLDEMGNPVSTVNTKGEPVAPALPSATPGAAGSVGTGLMATGGTSVTVGSGKPISVSNSVAPPRTTPTAGAAATGALPKGIVPRPTGPQKKLAPGVSPLVGGKPVRPQSIAQQMALEESSPASVMNSASSWSPDAAPPVRLAGKQGSAAGVQGEADRMSHAAAARHHARGASDVPYNMESHAQLLSQSKDSGGFNVKGADAQASPRIAPAATYKSKPKSKATFTSPLSFRVTSKFDSHKAGTDLGNFWIQSPGCKNKKVGDKFVISNKDGYSEEFTAQEINPNDGRLCLVQPDRTPPSVTLSSSPMLKWIVGM
tara:strand:- start:1407 stop:2576 length:1170 start_codon:yes stop_codon:yes gene_type:complete